MASAETVQKIVCDQTVANAVKQLVKMFKERLDPLKATLNVIALQIADDAPQNRPKYLAVLTGICRQFSTKLTAVELMEGLDKVLIEEGNRIVKRQRRLARVACICAFSRAGIFKNNHPLVRSLVESLISLSEQNSWMTLACYQAICDICERDVPNQDIFLDNVFEKLSPLLEDVPSTCDKLYLWVRLKQQYPKMKIGEWAENSLTKSWLAQFEVQLEGASALLPSLHPIWTILAEIDANALLQIVTELWLEDKTHRQLVSMAVAAVVPCLAVSELVALLKNTKLFETALSIRQNEAFTNALSGRLTKLVEVGDEHSFEAILALLAVPRDHTFVTQFLNNVCSHLSDGQTRRLLENVEDMSFKALVQLLWVQKHRETMRDLSILGDLFVAAAAKAKVEEQKIELSKFIAVNMTKKAEDGRTWFAVLTGVELPSNDFSPSIEDLIKETNSVVAGVNRLSEMIQIRPIFEECQVDIASFISFVTVLNKSKYDHWHSVSQILMRKSLPFLDSQNISVLFREPELLSLAVKTPALAAVALPMFVEHIEKLPKTFWREFNPEEKLRYPITPDDALSILPNVLSRCNGKSREGLQEKIAVTLFEMIDDEKATELVLAQVDKILQDDKGVIGGSEVVSQLVKTSPQLAYDVITHLTEVAPSVERQSGQKKLQQWISDCCESSEVPATAISQAIYAALDHTYGDTASGKKKAEAALSWAQKLIKKLTREIPRDIFGELADKIIATGSRTAANIIRQIANVHGDE